MEITISIAVWRRCRCFSFELLSLTTVPHSHRCWNFHLSMARFHTIDCGPHTTTHLEKSAERRRFWPREPGRRYSPPPRSAPSRCWRCWRYSSPPRWKAPAHSWVASTEPTGLKSTLPRQNLRHSTGVFGQHNTTPQKSSSLVHWPRILFTQSTVSISTFCFRTKN